VISSSAASIRSRLIIVSPILKTAESLSSNTTGRLNVTP